MKLIKKFITVILIGTMCSTSSISVSASDNSLNISFPQKENTWDLPANKYNKLHFYILDSEYATIDTSDEMSAAFSSLETHFASTTNNPETDLLNVTIQFTSDFTQTDEYIELAGKRSELKDIDEVHEWREELNSYSKIYHSNLIESNLSSLV